MNESGRFQSDGLRRWALLLVVGVAVEVFGPVPAHGQIGRDSIPSIRYYNNFTLYYDGEYREALTNFQAEGRSGIKTAQSRWIDSICYHTMTGECLYQMGRLPEALAQYTSALKIYKAFSDWMIRVQFPPAIQSAAAGARANVPWGHTTRNAKIGQFRETFQMGQGRIDNNDVIKNGGVVQNPVLFPVHVSEIVRATTLALRRRHELMGPLCAHDPLTRELVTVLSRRATLPNHWSEAWVDIQLGIAKASAGNAAEAAALLDRSIVTGGEYDHPLTSTALFELGRLALEGGNLAAAARYFEETTYSAVNFPDLALLEEAFRYGQLTHLLSNQKGPYPPLLAALEWSRVKKYRQLHASLSLLAAENLAILGETTKAAALAADARGTIGRKDMLASAIGARLNLITALTLYQAGNVAGGDQALAAALKYQTGGSLWLFQIALADLQYMNGNALSDRIAALLYQSLLRDPTSVDWASSPLECLSVLTTPHLAVYDHWFELARKSNSDHELALEIADRARRHRYFSTLPLGGRLLSLRWVLEAPAEQLNELALLQRQDLLARYPKYEELARQGQKIRGELADKKLADDATDARRERARQLAALGDISLAQEVLLRQIAVRREPVEMVFPPLRKTKEIQRQLPSGHALLAFYASDRNLHAFLISRDNYAMWRIASPDQLKKQLVAWLRDLGNYEQNHPLSQSDLTHANWKKSAAKVMDLLFEKSTVDLSLKFDELIIVPDGPLWYLPFEALQVGKGDQARPLITQVRMRYAPTVGLATPIKRAHKPRPNVGVVLGKLYPHDTEAVAQTAFEKMGRSLSDAIVWPKPLPAASSLYRTLFDELIVLDDIPPSEAAPYEWSPAPSDRGKAGGTLSAWLALPWGGPQYVLLPGFHSAAEGALKRGASGNDLFLATCGLLSTGTRTVLISRWRTGGQTSFNLVRELAQELPRTSPADAWQRSVEIARDMPLDLELEPRVKRFAIETDPPKAEHPFFWSGYLLIDSGTPPEGAPDDKGPLVLDFQKKLPAAGAGPKRADKAGDKPQMKPPVDPVANANAPPEGDEAKPPSNEDDPPKDNKKSKAKPAPKTLKPKAPRANSRRKTAGTNQ